MRRKEDRKVRFVTCGDGCRGIHPVDGEEVKDERMEDETEEAQEAK